MFFLFHLILSMVVGIGIWIAFILLGIEKSIAIWIVLGIMLIQFIDIDHTKENNYKELLEASAITNKTQMQEYETLFERGIMHKLSTFYSIMFFMMGIAIGYTMHLSMDNILK